MRHRFRFSDYKTHWDFSLKKCVCCVPDPQNPHSSPRDSQGEACRRSSKACVGISLQRGCQPGTAMYQVFGRKKCTWKTSKYTYIWVPTLQHGGRSCHIQLEVATTWMDPMYHPGPFWKPPSGQKHSEPGKREKFYLLLQILQPTVWRMSRPSRLANWRYLGVLNVRRPWQLLV